MAATNRRMGRRPFLAGAGAAMAAAFARPPGAAAAGLAGLEADLGLVPNIAGLRAGGLGREVVLVAGYHGAGDGGGGVFVRDPADRGSRDDGGLVIVDATGNRWKRGTGGLVPSVRWFGARGDGAADDASAFAAAREAVSELHIPAGTYLLSALPGAAAGLALKSNFQLHGAGIGATVLRLAPAQNAPAILGPHGGSHFALRDLTIDHDGARQAGGNGILILESSDFAIENVEVRTACNAGIVLMRQPSDAPGFTGCQRFRVRGCIVSTTLKGHGIVIDHSAFGSINGNQVHNPAESGIQLYVSSDVTVTGNVVEHDGIGGRHRSGFAGVRVTATAGETRNISVAGNSVAGFSRGLFIGQHVMSSSFVANTVENIGLDGIYLTQCRDNVVSGNTVRGAGQEQAGKYSGILVEDSQGTLVAHNRVFDGDSPRRLEWGISERALTNDPVVGRNYFVGNLVAGGQKGALHRVSDQSRTERNLLE